MKTMHWQKVRKKHKAFALAETIIALLILAIALLAMAFVPIMSSKLALQTVQKERALALAHSRLDILEAAKDDVTASQDVVGIYTLKYSRSYGDNNAVVEVSWGGLTKQTQLTLRRDLSKEARVTAKGYKE